MNTLEKQFCDSSHGSSAQMAKPVPLSAYINMESKPILIPSKKKAASLAKPAVVVAPTHAHVPLHESNVTHEIKQMISVEEKRMSNHASVTAEKADDSQDVLANFANQCAAHCIHRRSV